ncbi:hypothetical protein EX895_003359 [Sporisorium graminicola]|uniref:Glycosylphosphatidylinositol anchor biosynthesis protein 11 n=1 Tax=Sporisorium graminicola TaxID=280036 RepID=A0A4U7KWD8_9BASI|nr:hypothetical protein EX895_003359 [Sporisorium graminicola]TKY87778.1 hypothetical protein EX895_003359 [Sporisorium graminicola]
MGPKPRMTIARPPAAASARPVATAYSSSGTTTTTTTATTSTASRPVRRKRWVYAPATLILLLLLHAFCHVFAFVLLTEPCLNPAYTSRMMDKLNYVSLLASRGAIPVGEWGERFTRAGVRGLFGVGVIQAWFTARLNSYVLKAHRQHASLLRMLRAQRASGTKVGVDTRWHEAEAKEEESEEAEAAEVGSFVRQMESVSVTFLGLPLVVAAVYAAVVLAGAPAVGAWKQTLVLAAHLAMLIALPLVHILGIPDISVSTTPHASTQSTAQPPPPSASSTSLPNASTHWTALLTLKPNPTFLLPLYYPLIGCFLGTLASTAVLALDWNVAYQTYPFPLLVGSLLGLVLGDLYTIAIVLFG